MLEKIEQIGSWPVLVRVIREVDRVVHLCKNSSAARRVETRSGDCLRTVLHRSLFLNALCAEALEAFVLHHLSSDIYIVNNLGI